jgi:hypothetical protein
MHVTCANMRAIKCEKLVAQDQEIAKQPHGQG